MKKITILLFTSLVFFFLLNSFLDKDARGEFSEAIVEIKQKLNLYEGSLEYHISRIDDLENQLTQKDLLIQELRSQIEFVSINHVNATPLSRSTITGLEKMDQLPAMNRTNNHIMTK